jgi:hypothetical protein
VRDLDNDDDADDDDDDDDDDATQRTRYFQCENETVPPNISRAGRQNVSACDVHCEFFE